MQGAEYRHSKHDCCLMGTRTSILDEIELWTHNFHKPNVYWLNGLAGTGKSTIAQTVAERLSVDGKLGASFFCSRDFEDRSNLQFILPTIAAQLARRYPKYRSILIPLVQFDPEIIHEALYSQMEKLIVQPLMESAISTVIIIDALDECEENEPTSGILSVLGRFVKDIPKVKFFITSRPEPCIQNSFRPLLLGQAIDQFLLHGINPSQVKDDILLFYKHKFSEIRNCRQVSGDWPTREQLELLCERAAGLFIYAMATVRLIDRGNRNPKKQLDQLILSQESKSEGKVKLKDNKTLDSLYMLILHEALGDNDIEDNAEVQLVLGAVVFATIPLSSTVIATLLGFDPDDIYPLLSPMSSLLLLSKDIDHPIQPFHMSFPDFIIDPDRCVDKRFCLYPPDQHTNLLFGCLELMNQKLEQNMCKLTGGVTNAEVKDLKQRTERYIDKALEYACRSWHKHFSDTTSMQKLKIISLLDKFLEKKFLFWLEVLSVLGATREAIDALERTEKWLDVCCISFFFFFESLSGLIQASQTLNLTKDCFNFVIAFFDIISISAPHIYISALPLSPQTSIVRSVYKESVHSSVKVIHGLPISWDAALTTIYCEGLSRGVAWSPCGRFIAIAKSWVVEILDGATLKCLNTFKYLKDTQCDHLLFSPDGHTLTQHGEVKLIHWDLQTGVPLSTPPSAGKIGYAVKPPYAYSVDGRILVVLSYLSQDSTLINTYDFISGTHTGSYPSPEGCVATPLWTSGEHFCFTTVKPGSITIWEAAFTSISTPAIIETLLAPDEITHEVHIFLFLPALFLLAFAAQDKILIWDAQNSRFLLKSEPHFPVGSNMSFSSDGHFFSHTSNDQEAYVWKRSTASYLLHQRVALPLRYMSIFLSPDGESIIAAGRSLLCLWHTRDQVFSPPRVLTWDHFLLEFSPNEVLAAFAHYGGNTATIINLQSGDPELTIDTGMQIECLKLTGSMVAVASREKIITWNIPTKKHANTKLGVAKSVNTLMLGFSDPSAIWNPFQSGNNLEIRGSISPDCSHIAIIVHTIKSSIQIQNISTGRQFVGAEVPERPGSIVLKEGEVWYMGGACDEDEEESVKGWRIVGGGKSGIDKLEPLEVTTCPPPVFPWQSCLGYEVTPDGWVLSPAKKRLLWLPHHWRSKEKFKTWSGRFLGLVHSEVPEVVILEFFE